MQLSELIDRLAGKVDSNVIYCFLPDKHYWPERSIKHASSLQEQKMTESKFNRPRPMQLLATPEKIEVYHDCSWLPTYVRKLHKIKKA